MNPFYNTSWTCPRCGKQIDSASINVSFQNSTEGQVKIDAHVASHGGWDEL